MYLTREVKTYVQEGELASDPPPPAGGPRVSSAAPMEVDKSDLAPDKAAEQAAIAGALLAYRTGPGQDVFTTNQITSALVAYRSAADQDTATASSIAATLLSYYTIAQVDDLLAGKLGVTEAASALQIAVRFPDDGGPTRWWPP